MNVLNEVAIAEVLEDLREERSRQDAKFGDQSHLPDGTADAWWRECTTDPGQWSLIRGMGARHARLNCQNAFARNKGTWRHILLEEVCEAFEETDAAKLRAELVQVAAVAVAWIEAIDRRGGAR